MKYLLYLFAVIAAFGLFYVLYLFPIAPVSLSEIRIDGRQPVNSDQVRPPTAVDELASFKGAEKRYQRFRALHLKIVVISIAALLALCLVSVCAALKL
jgi:hypothetical protein